MERREAGDGIPFCTPEWYPSNQTGTKADGSLIIVLDGPRAGLHVSFTTFTKTKNLTYYKIAPYKALTAWAENCRNHHTDCRISLRVAQNPFSDAVYHQWEAELKAEEERLLRRFARTPAAEADVCHARNPPPTQQDIVPQLCDSQQPSASPKKRTTTHDRGYVAQPSMHCTTAPPTHTQPTREVIQDLSRQFGRAYRPSSRSIDILSSDEEADSSSASYSGRRAPSAPAPGVSITITASCPRAEPSPQPIHRSISKGAARRFPSPSTPLPSASSSRAPSSITHPVRSPARARSTSPRKAQGSGSYLDGMYFLILAHGSPSVITLDEDSARSEMDRFLRLNASPELSIARGWTQALDVAIGVGDSNERPYYVLTTDGASSRIVGDADQAKVELHREDAAGHRVHVHVAMCWSDAMELLRDV
ncbi:hypothetical protein BD626DRAFT_579199 [Schizophyllum amplum]|uniref:Uncharacterized protein n=1 Tax=Schizophyllum amplum TaxID=97359 RepID=A0A550BRM5_9AGAR|nr:hypothetical protein BD626DRAFT_579199 [Auriculariopsis ampla]